MYPHRIRLRGPWELEPTGASAPAASRLLMPAAWPQLGLGDWAGAVILRRRFGYPGRIDAWERVWLVGEGLEGPAEIRLQGQVLAQGAHDAFALEVTSLLGERNVLEVYLDIAPGRQRLWDDIALEVRASAYLADVTGERDAEGSWVRGRVAGTCPGPLEVYVLAAGRNCGYQMVTVGAPFRVHLEHESPALRVELVHVSQVWHVVEIPFR